MISKDTVICIIRDIILMPHDIAHIRTDTTNGMLWIETDHALAGALNVGEAVVFEGERKIERAITFLINVKRTV